MNAWPHGPPHRLTEQGAYMVTCGTYGKIHYLNTESRLNFFRRLFFEGLTEFGWEPHAWAIHSNHYHFIASSPAEPGNLGRMLSKLHTLTARELNAQDGQPGRKVWYQYFDSHLTYTNSYMARLKYVHNNPVHHGLLACAENYPWCSACWFTQNAKPAFQATINGFKIDALSVLDSFAPRMPTASDRESGVKPPHSK